MTIRPATLADVPRLVAMGRAQLAATYGDAVADNPAQLEAVATQLVTMPAGAVFVAERDGAVVGMIGLVEFVHHLSGLPTVGEVMWWVDPAARGGGLALLRRGEQWARAQGARVLQVAAPQGTTVGTLYARRGYAPVETTYQRTLAAAGGADT
jgi:GNAT superfamily N-acetyltransferase